MKIKINRNGWLATLLFLTLSPQNLPTVKAQHQCSSYYGNNCKEYERRIATRSTIYSKGYYRTEYYHIERALPSYYYSNKILRLKWESFRLSGDMPDCSKDKLVVSTG